MQVLIFNQNVLVVNILYQNMITKYYSMLNNHIGTIK